MEPELLFRVKVMSELIGYSANQLIAESVKGILDGADDETNPMPRVIALIRAARNHQKRPLQFR